jgi:hypothetical protein
MEVEFSANVLKNQWHSLAPSKVILFSWKLITQHAFIPFAFDTFCFLAPEAASLLQRIQNVMNSNGVSPRAKNIIFTRIGFVIQNGLAAQLVAPVCL